MLQPPFVQQPPNRDKLLSSASSTKLPPSSVHQIAFQQRQVSQQQRLRHQATSQQRQVAQHHKVAERWIGWRTSAANWSHGASNPRLKPADLHLMSNPPFQPANCSRRTSNPRHQPARLLTIIRLMKHPIPPDPPDRLHCVLAALRFTPLCPFWQPTRLFQLAPCLWAWRQRRKLTQTHRQQRGEGKHFSLLVHLPRPVWDFVCFLSALHLSQLVLQRCRLSPVFCAADIQRRRIASSFEKQRQTKAVD
jgi:hypothetical protein